MPPKLPLNPFTQIALNLLSPEKGKVKQLVQEGLEELTALGLEAMGQELGNQLGAMAEAIRNHRVNDEEQKK